MHRDWRQQVQKRFQKYAVCFQQNNAKLISADDYASVALILVEGDRGPGFLVIKRQHNPHDPWSGHMALPGGRAQKGEGPVGTAIRETFEEINLELPAVRNLMEPVEARARQSMASFSIYPCLFITEHHWTEISTFLRPCPHEVESIHLFSLRELLDPRHQSKIHWNQNGKDITLPSIQIGRHTIWGLTYWILEQFFKEIEGVSLSFESNVDLKDWRKHPTY